MPILAATVSGPDPEKHATLEVTVGDKTHVIRWQSVLHDLEYDLDRLLLSLCRDEDESEDRKKAGAAVREELEEDDGPIFCYAPWDFVDHVSMDLEIEAKELWSRIVDIRALVCIPGEPMLSLESIAEMYGIRYLPTGRSEDEAKVIAEILKRHFHDDLPPTAEAA